MSAGEYIAWVSGAFSKVVNLGFGFYAAMGFLGVILAFIFANLVFNLFVKPFMAAMVDTAKNSKRTEGKSKNKQSSNKNVKRKQ